MHFTAIDDICVGVGFLERVVVLLFRVVSCLVNLTIDDNRMR